MAKTKRSSSSSADIKRKKAITIDGRENQMIALATDLAEKQLMDGSAPPSVIVHYLKLGSTKERIEKEILERQKELIEAKTENLQSAKRVEELYTDAIKWMKIYSGHGEKND